MKVKSTLTIVILLVLFAANRSYAQAPVYKEATLSHPAEMWEPFKLSDQGTNIKSGVQIYVQNTQCASQKVKVVKLINQNSYPVTLSYQLTPESSIVSVRIPAAYSIEGACGSSDDNLRKLIISVPEDKLNSNIEFIRSHIMVSSL